jgi:hypothetical protein
MDTSTFTMLKPMFRQQTCLLDHQRGPSMCATASSSTAGEHVIFETPRYEQEDLEASLIAKDFELELKEEC